VEQRREVGNTSTPAEEREKHENFHRPKDRQLRVVTVDSAKVGIHAPNMWEEMICWAGLAERCDGPIHEDAPRSVWRVLAH
jgi:hypothetical protein